MLSPAPQAGKQSNPSAIVCIQLDRKLTVCFTQSESRSQSLRIMNGFGELFGLAWWTN
jgi:hypothetical protein